MIVKKNDKDVMEYVITLARVLVESVYNPAITELDCIIR